MILLSQSDKELENLNVVGKFGLGFKSVFLVSERPLIFSGRLRFCIEGGFLPQTLSDKEIEYWNLEIKQIKNIKSESDKFTDADYEKELRSELEKNTPFVYDDDFKEAMISVMMGKSFFYYCDNAPKRNAIWNRILYYLDTSSLSALNKVKEISKGHIIGEEN